MGGLLISEALEGDFTSTMGIYKGILWVTCTLRYMCSPFMGPEEWQGPRWPVMRPDGMQLAMALLALGTPQVYDGQLHCCQIPPGHLGQPSQKN
jgi:hypothetical protein